MLYDLAELRYLFGEDLDSLKELLNNFGVDAAISLEKIDEACLTGNEVVVRNELHKFIGMVTNLHIDSIKDILKNMDIEIRENGLNAANMSNINLVTTTISKVIGQLKNESIV